MRAHAGHVLLIEDHQALRDLVRTRLGLAGYSVWVARDTQIARALLHTADAPLVVVLDLSPFPHSAVEVDGLEVLRDALEHPELLRRHAFILTTTAAERLCSIVEWLPSGVELPVLRKPYQMAELMRLIAQAASYLSPSTQPADVTVPRAFVAAASRYARLRRAL